MTVRMVKKISTIFRQETAECCHLPRGTWQDFWQKSVGCNDECGGGDAGGRTEAGDGVQDVDRVRQSTGGHEARDGRVSR